MRALIEEARKIAKLDKAAALGLARTTEDGVTFETGREVTFRYWRFTGGKTPNFGKTYGQDIEPAGRYMTHVEQPSADIADRGESGEVTFKNPLVIQLTGDPASIYGEQGWKARLSAYYKAKGRALSRKVRADGHDGIVTVDKYGTSEIVDLISFA